MLDQQEVLTRVVTAMEDHINSRGAWDDAPSVFLIHLIDDEMATVSAVEEDLWYPLADDPLEALAAYTRALPAAGEADPTVIGGVLAVNAVTTTTDDLRMVAAVTWQGDLAVTASRRKGGYLPRITVKEHPQWAPARHIAALARFHRTGRP